MQRHTHTHVFPATPHRVQQPAHTCRASSIQSRVLDEYDTLASPVGYTSACAFSSWAYSVLSSGFPRFSHLKIYMYVRMHEEALTITRSKNIFHTKSNQPSRWQGVQQHAGEEQRELHIRVPDQ